jgi:hypothetical protein
LAKSAKGPVIDCDDLFHSNAKKQAKLLKKVSIPKRPKDSDSTSKVAAKKRTVNKLLKIRPTKTKTQQKSQSASGSTKSCPFLAESKSTAPQFKSNYFVPKGVTAAKASQRSDSSVQPKDSEVSDGYKTSGDSNFDVHQHLAGISELSLPYLINYLHLIVLTMPTSTRLSNKPLTPPIDLTGAPRGQLACKLTAKGKGSTSESRVPASSLPPERRRPALPTAQCKGGGGDSDVPGRRSPGGGLFPPISGMEPVEAMLQAGEAPKNEFMVQTNVSPGQRPSGST